MVQLFTGFIHMQEIVTHTLISPKAALSLSNVSVSNARANHLCFMSLQVYVSYIHCWPLCNRNQSNLHVGKSNN